MMGGRGLVVGGGKGRGRGGRPAAALMDGSREFVPPQPVDLLPLPHGLPETCYVTCEGHVGIFHTRTQRVTYKGEDMSASRLEQIGGHGT